MSCPAYPRLRCVLTCCILLFGLPAVAAQQFDIQARLNANCDGKKPGVTELPAGRFEVVAPVGIPSFCTVRGQGAGVTMLVASAQLAGDVLVVERRSRVVLKDFAVDANRPARSKPTNAIAIHESDHVTILGVRAGNAPNAALLISGFARDILVENSIFYGSGAPLPSSAGAGLAISPGEGQTERVMIRANRIYGNNQGIAIFNSPASGSHVREIVIDANRIFGNADEGISVNSANAAGGLIENVAITDNQSLCNGWTANGSEFPDGCVPQRLQNGKAASSAGVGIDLIGGSIRQVRVSGNQAHHNVFDGISSDGRRFWKVNVAGTTVRAQSGPAFDRQWMANQPMSLDTKTVLLGKVISSSELQLASEAPVHGEATLSVSSRMDTMIERNRVFGNGTHDVGAGIWNEAADGITYAQNHAWSNQLDGFGCTRAMALRYVDNRATENNRGQRPAFEFAARGCRDVTYQDSAVRNDAQNKDAAEIFVDRHSGGMRIESEPEPRSGSTKK